MIRGEEYKRLSKELKRKQEEELKELECIEKGVPFTAGPEQDEKLITEIERVKSNVNAMRFEESIELPRLNQGDGPADAKSAFGADGPDLEVLEEEDNESMAHTAPIT